MWDIVRKDKFLMYLYIKIDTVPKITYAVTINEKLELNISYKSYILPKLNNVGTLPVKVSNINQIHCILKILDCLDENQIELLELNLENCYSLLLSVKDKSSDERKNILNFLSEQVFLLKFKSTHYHYSPEMKIFSSLLFLISPQASHANGSVHVDSFEDCGSEVEHHEINNNNTFNEITVTDDDIESVKEQLPIITYLAGYCVYSVLKRMSCDICKAYLVLDKALCVNENFKLIQSTD